MPAKNGLPAILVVDDDPEDCLLYEKVLSGAGYAVSTAPSAERARRLIEKKSFGVLLLDIHLPDGDGLSLQHTAQEKDPHTVAVVITAYSSVENAVAAVRAGAYDFLIKPCPSERLVTAVHRAAERYDLGKALSERTDELESMNRTLDNRVKEATAEIFELNERLRRYISDLVETNNKQTRFLEDMAHELKNPLAVVWGYTSFLTSRPAEEWTPAEVKKSLGAVHRNAKHLHDLIDELLDTSRLASRKIVLKREPLSAADLVGDVVESLRIQADHKGVALAAELPKASGAEVYADPTRLRQILVNLVTNAVKFTPAGGSISVAAKRRSGHVRFTVADTGRGMCEKDCERIFERFYQAAGSQEHAHKGLGLGLNIVQGLVKLHGGRVWAESQEGRGTRFTFTIPDEEPAAPKDRPSAEEAVPSPN